MSPFARKLQRVNHPVDSGVLALADDFSGNLSLWPGSFGTRSAANGRARIRCDTGNSGILSATTYSLVGKSIFARAFPPSANGASTEALLNMNVNSITSGTGLNIRINQATGTIAFRSVVGFVDANAVTIPYDEAQHAWIRIREQGGTVYWETAPESGSGPGTWTNRRVTNAATPAWLTATPNQSISFTCHRDSGTPDFGEVDNVNIAAVPNENLNLWHSPQGSDSLVPANPELAAIYNQPRALWVGEWYSNPQTSVANFATMAAGRTMVMPVYAIPNRDSGGYSAGGFPNQAAYLNWVTGVKNGAGNAPVLYILEPDALGLAHGLSAGAKAERIDTLSQAAAILKQGSRAKVYIDMGTWISAGEAADLLIGANIATCEGFSINVSNFQTTANMHTYGNQVVASLASKGHPGKKYVIDTTRNGNGPLTSAFGPVADPWLNVNKHWCNPPGRGLGLSPRIPVGQPNCAALLWIKTAGASDGNDPGSTFFSDYFSENAPNAGTFWLEWMQDCIAHTDMSNLL
ncbi:MAG: glycoside hydrolase family 6 protein [Candidatus Saccharimonadales bacterium]